MGINQSTGEEMEDDEEGSLEPEYESEDLEEDSDEDENEGNGTHVQISKRKEQNIRKILVVEGVVIGNPNCRTLIILEEEEEEEEERDYNNHGKRLLLSNSLVEALALKRWSKSFTSYGTLQEC